MKKICVELAAALTALTMATGCSTNKTQKMPTTDEDSDMQLPERDRLLPSRYQSDDGRPAADETFEDFVFYFANNEDLQRRRIDFPLEFAHGSHTDSIGSGQWHMDPLFMGAGEYTLIFDSPEQRELVGNASIGEVTVEKIRLGADSLLQYVFSRQDGRWHLVGLRQQALADGGNASFLSFYSRFASDSAFQQQSLCSEIAFSGADPDDDFAQMEGFITPDSWDAFAPELPSDSIYNIVYGQQSPTSRSKVLVVCGIANGQELELSFRQERGKWKLAKMTE